MYGIFLNVNKMISEEDERKIEAIIQFYYSMQHNKFNLEQVLDQYYTKKAASVVKQRGTQK